MNRKQLTLLIVLGVVLGGLAYTAWRKTQDPYQTSAPSMGSLFITHFTFNDVEQIVIKQPKEALALAKQSEQCVVKDRGDYPANFDHVRELLRKLWELKIAKP